MGMVTVEVNLDDLLSLLNRAAAGGEVSESDVNSVRWESDDPIIWREANEAWLALRHFVDDAKIIKSDKQYDDAFRKNLLSHVDGLNALIRGEDPNRRRATWLHRTLWRLGIIP